MRYWPSICSTPVVEQLKHKLDRSAGGAYSVSGEPVTVAMCTYRGARYVDAQLQSVLDQEWPVRLVVADDASGDDTVARVRTRLRCGVDTLLTHHDNVGYVRNFERTLQGILDSGATYIALSDQDDIWSPARISHGMQTLQTLERVHGTNRPLLVHSDLQLMAADGQALHDSFLQYRHYRIQPCKNLPVILGENGVMGNTILMNRALVALALPFPADLHVHDYWLALLAELFGERGMLSEPLVHYRLHTDNASNTASAMRSGWQRRVSRAFNGSLLTCNFKLPFKEDSRLAVLEFLLSEPARFPPLQSDQRAELEAFVRYLAFQQPRFTSLGYLLRSGITRGGLLHRARLCLATLLTTRYSRSSET